MRCLTSARRVGDGWLPPGQMQQKCTERWHALIPVVQLGVPLIPDPSYIYTKMYQLVKRKKFF